MHRQPQPCHRRSEKSSCLLLVGCRSRPLAHGQVGGAPCPASNPTRAQPSSVEQTMAAAVVGWGVGGWG